MPTACMIGACASVSPTVSQRCVSGIFNRLGAGNTHGLGPPPEGLEGQTTECAPLSCYLERCLTRKGQILRDALGNPLR